MHRQTGRLCAVAAHRGRAGRGLWFIGRRSNALPRCPCRPANGLQRRRPLRSRRPTPRVTPSHARRPCSRKASRRCAWATWRRRSRSSTRRLTASSNCRKVPARRPASGTTSIGSSTAISAYEIRALSEGDGFSERPSVPASIDELLDLATFDFPAPPLSLRESVESDLKSTAHDVPIPPHPKVLAYVDLFQGRLREWFQTALDRGAPYLPMIKARLLARKACRSTSPTCPSSKARSSPRRCRARRPRGSGS